MKLVIHIGAHKTGSTALQRHLRANSASLAELGVHYAAPDSALMANAVADALCAGRAQVVQDFFSFAVEAAESKGAHTVIVSAENFYGMTLVSALRQRRSCSHVLEQERVIVHQLDQLIPPGIGDRQIVCYLRRPDHFAESWYNQHVKGSSLFDGTFTEFLEIIYPTLLYDSVLRIWSDVFGRSKCSVRVYEDCRGDIVTDFLSSVMQIDAHGFVREAGLANARLSRELLEFKRERNTTIQQSQKASEYRVFAILERRLAATHCEPREYSEFLSPQERADLLDALESEIEALQRSYDLPPFPAFDLKATTDWTPYPGLSRERRERIEREYRKIQKSWRVRFSGLVERYAGKTGQRPAPAEPEPPRGVGLHASEFGRRTKA